MKNNFLTTEIARHIWETKYRYREGERVYDQTLLDTWRRMAKALASVEKADQKNWEQKFYQILEGFKFLPAGRIHAGAGTSRRVTLFNCFVMGLIGDSMEGIFDGLKEGALTMQQGGGVGYDFSTLRPKGVRAKSVGAIASGPVSFMKVWDSMCATLLSTGTRRGAMMATLRCDHPDIENFVEAKHEAGQLTHFNLSVQVTDAFMEAVRRDQEWALVFPSAALEKGAAGETVMRFWPGYSKGEPISCQVLRKVQARKLWEKILKSAYDTAEPGVLFMDRINRVNNLWYCEQIGATNPCGEIPLPPYGACDLGSINLTQFVKDPFTNHARVDIERIQEITTTAVRFLDNVIDLSRYPLDRQKEQAQSSRRIGLGVTGLGDMFILLEMNYTSQEAKQLAASIFATICHTAYRGSIELAREKGVFSNFNREKYLQSEFIRSLPEDIQAGIKEYGIRNSHLIAIAPAGTISLLAGNVSSGIEPVYSFCHTRRVTTEEETFKTFELTDYAWRLWREKKGTESKLPDYFVDAHQIAPSVHLEMQAALQSYVDNSISKTINIPEDYDFGSFTHLYDLAYDLGLKGCTVFRSTPLRGEILSPRTQEVKERECCPTV
jgi:ribonucleoside-diphosphate reductase alpha chain